MPRGGVVDPLRGSALGNQVDDRIHVVGLVKNRQRGTLERIDNRLRDRTVLEALAVGPPTGDLGGQWPEVP
jgi:hypothetical protein